MDHGNIARWPVLQFDLPNKTMTMVIKYTYQDEVYGRRKTGDFCKAMLAHKPIAMLRDIN